VRYQPRNNNNNNNNFDKYDRNSLKVLYIQTNMTPQFKLKCYSTFRTSSCNGTLVFWFYTTLSQNTVALSKIKTWLRGTSCPTMHRRQ